MRVIIAFIAIFLSLGISTPVCAQTKITTFYKIVGETVVQTKPSAIIYRLDSMDEYYLFCSSADRRHVAEIDSNNKQKLLKKSAMVKVVAFTNIKKQFDFDTYVIEYKGGFWFLSSNNVVDNTVLADRNRLVEGYYSGLKQNVANAKKRLEDERYIYLKICQDSVAYYKQRVDKIPMLKDSMLNAIKTKNSNILKAEQDKLDAAYREWYNRQPASTKQALNIINITDARLCSPNSVGGCDYRFEYINKSRKSIKYLYWEGTFYNAVNDVVYCDIRRYCNFIGKDTGPVAHGARGGGVWDCVIYNHSADTLKLNKVRIIYLDGSTTTIAASDIRQMLSAPSTEIPYELKSQMEHEVFLKQLELRNLPMETEYRGGLRMWEERLAHLQDIYDSYWRPQVPIEFHRRDNYNPIYLKLNELKQGIRKEQMVVDAFERVHFLK